MSARSARGRPRRFGRLRFGLAVSVAWAIGASAAGSAAAEEVGTAVDRVAVRFTTPETGGVARPLFLTERQLAFFVRCEAAMDRVPMPEGEYSERYVRLAMDRLMARSMLAALLLRRGEEPPALPRMVTDAREDLADRVGGEAALTALLKREGIEESELARMLRDQVRAAWYVDAVVTPIDAITEDALREAFRSAVHPYRDTSYAEARDRLRRWVRQERFRSAELEFLQGARSRMTVDAVRPLVSPSTPSPP